MSRSLKNQIRYINADFENYQFFLTNEASSGVGRDLYRQLRLLEQNTIGR